jgi:hypothetical protein
MSASGDIICCILFLLKRTLSEETGLREAVGFSESIDFVGISWHRNFRPKVSSSYKDLQF